MYDKSESTDSLNSPACLGENFLWQSGQNTSRRRVYLISPKPPAATSGAVATNFIANVPAEKRPAEDRGILARAAFAPTSLVLFGAWIPPWCAKMSSWLPLASANYNNLYGVSCIAPNETIDRKFRHWDFLAMLN